jgi:phytanoyl-CoA hydroxylase
VPALTCGSYAWLVLESLYVAGAAAEPVAGGFGGLTDADVERYRRDGFLAIADAFSGAEVDAALSDLAAIAADPAHTALLMYEPGVDEAALASEDARCSSIRRIWEPVSVAAAAGIHRMATHPGLVALTTRLLDAPPTVFQSMALLKPPGIGTEKPWHQDHAYFALALGTPVVGVWIALDRATVDNGCMHVLSGRHRDGPVPHVQRRDWQICDDDVAGAASTVVPLGPGGCLLFDSLLPHGTPPNTSRLRRRALQIHFAPSGAEPISQETRLQVFGGEGIGAEC